MCVCVCEREREREREREMGRDRVYVSCMMKMHNKPCSVCSVRSVICLGEGAGANIVARFAVSSLLSGQPLIFIGSHCV